MKRHVLLDGKTVSYTIRESKRAKRISATIHASGELVVSLPQKKSERIVDPFLQEKKNWVLRHLDEIEKQDFVYIPNHTKNGYLLYKQYAEILIKKKVEKINEHYQFAIGRISVKNNRSQWGSCSHKKNLNFTYKIVFLPTELIDYIVVHELCHLKEFNHSKAFWNLVGETIPKCRAFDKELRRYHLQ